VRALAGRDGIELVPDLPDLRAEIVRHQVVVLPFISGGGIKNKLLEAAGMARPVVCSPRACGGLHAAEALPVIKARGGAGWARAIQALWRDESRRRQLGADARRWVLRHHSWDAAARSAEASLGRRLEARLP
jgi:glycosyltransferase involved in cell wall biosynthesis